MRQYKKFIQRVISGFILTSFVMSFFMALFILPIKYSSVVHAQIPVVDQLVAGAIGLSTATQESTKTAFQAKEIAKWFADNAKKKWRDALLYAAGIAIHSSLKKLISTWAHDIAVKIASGNAGQGALFEIRSAEQLLQDTRDNALGVFIENLGQGVWGEQFNLCNFDPDVQLAIGLGLTEGFYGGEPVNCSWNELTGKLSELSEREVGDVLRASLDPFSSEAGAALTLTGIGLEEVERAVSAAGQEYQAKGGWLDIRNIAGETKTPAETAKQFQSAGLKGTLDFARQMSGDILADAASVFLNTLFGEAIKKFLTKQIDPKRPSTTTTTLSGQTQLYSYESEAISSGQQGAADYYQSLKDIPFGNPESFDVLLELVATCREQDKWKCSPNANAITEKFRNAIEQRLTVGEAIDPANNMLNPNLPFGFGPNGTQLTREDGYPYRSILILRKYRIVPVGWEIAAEYIRNFGEVTSLGDLIDNYDNIDSPFYHLVDPNWVLKAPANYCLKQGFGPTITTIQEIPSSGEENEDYFRPATFTVTRDAGYCAEERGCILEDDDGSCLQYGYCTLERPTWDFDGVQSCDEWNDTCQSYSTRAGQIVSFLRSSLDYEYCSSSNVGCTWYCSEYNYSDSMWRCVDQTNVYNVCDQAAGCTVSQTIDGIYQECVIEYGALTCITEEGNVLYNGEPTAYGNADLYFDADVQECSEVDAGCSAFIALDAGAVNLFPNSSFEYGVDQDLGIVPAAEVTTPVEPYVAGLVLTDSSRQPSLVSDEALVGEYSLFEDHGSLLQIPIDTGWSVANRTFSFSIYAKSQDSTPPLGCTNYKLSINGATTIVIDEDAQGLPDWTRYSVVHTFGPNSTDNEIVLWIDSRDADSDTAGCFFDALQIEESSGPTDYNQYGGDLTYMIKPPPNYDCEGYTTIIEAIDDQETCLTASSGKPYYWRDDIERCVESGSEACANYGLYCRAEDVGCEFYNPTDGDPSVSAVIASSDYCPAECVGYDTFKQEATYLEDAAFPVYFIPSTATQCSANDVGCDEFTNLDTVAQGGEGLEYYSYVRQCKSESSSCGTFYSWVGSEDTGYQLRVHSLQVDERGNIEEIDASAPYYYSDGDCASIEDALENPECKQLFDTQGNEHFVFIRNTYSCTDECKPYRKTNIGIAEGVSQADCTDPDKEYLGDWAGDVGICYLCSKYGGTMFTDAATDTGNDGIVGNEMCIFHIVPNEGVTCSGEFAGCREYTGDAGEGVLTVFRDDFELGLDNWEGDVQLSTESTVVGSHSLKIPSGTTNPVYSAIADYGGNCLEDEGCQATAATTDYSCIVEKDEQYCGIAGDIFQQGLYTITFWAKSDSFDPQEEKLYLIVDIAGVNGASLAINDEWNAYAVGPIEITEDVSQNATISISRNGSPVNVYIDNIEIKALSDTVYAVKDSWNTPSSCDQDENGVDSPQYMLGCSQYTDTAGNVLNLKSFSSICREEVVGCEAFIDTFNSTWPFKQTLGEGESEINIEADRAVFFVDDPDNRCTSTAKGCQALGKPTYDENYQWSGFETQYLINDPDEYDTIACQATELWCDEFDSGEGVDYFKNPLSQVCQYKQVDANYGEGWYKINTTEGPPDCPTFISEIGTEIPAFATCQGGENVGRGCITDRDCPNSTCVRDNWAGACFSEVSGCTAYIDPVSSIESNLLYNAEFEANVDGNAIPDNWEDVTDPRVEEYSNQGIGSSKAILVSPSSHNIMQNIPDLKQNTLYTLSFFARTDPESSYGTNDYIQIKITNLENIAGDPPQNISSFDDSIVLDDPADDYHYQTVSLQIAGNNLSDDYTRFSGRFFSGEAITGNLQIDVSSPTGGKFWVDNISLVETGVYYKIKDEVDYTSCQDQVDPGAGCVLFNDRSQVNYHEYANSMQEYFQQPADTEFDVDYLGNDADQSPTASGIASTYCENGNLSTGLCDSNSIIKVKRDRMCKEWLYCQTSTTASISEGAQEEDICLEVGKCARMDSEGRCSELVPTERENLVFNKSSVTRLANITGYSKVGYDWGTKGGVNQIVGGYYSTDKMYQLGSTVVIENGSFEVFDKAGRPFGWDGADPDAFDSGDFNTYSSIADIQTVLATSQTSLPPDGKAFIGVSALKAVLLEHLAEVFPRTDYVLSGFLNTSVLSNAAGTVELAEFDANGLQLTEYTPFLVLQPGHSWTELSHHWQTGQKTAQIGLKLTTTTDEKFFQKGAFEEVSGSVFFDNLRIDPSLLMRDATVDYQYSYDPRYLSTRSCRLYPEENAPACEYVNDLGTFRRGWYGYCLEKDPQNPRTCITWWPVDQIQGDSIDASSYEVYTDRYPLYLCTGMQMMKPDYIASTPIDVADDYSPSRCVQQGEYSWSDGYSKTLFKNEIDSITITIDKSHFLFDGVSSQDSTSSRWDRLTLNESNNWTKIVQNVGKEGKLEAHCPEGVELDYDSIGSCVCNEAIDKHKPTDPDDHKYEYAYGVRAVFTGVENPKFSHIEVVRDMYSERSQDSDGNNKELLPIQANVAFHLIKRMCTDVSQVVNQFGDNIVWAQRIDPMTKYSIDGLGWKYNTDYFPFGAVVPPEPHEDPLRWDGLKDTKVCTDDYSISCKSDDDCAGAGSCSFIANAGNQPLMWYLPDTSMDEPYQVRFSHPYAYTAGEANIPLALCEDTTQMCFYDSDCPGGEVGGERCDRATSVQRGNLDTYSKAMEKARLVFAKSYGTWHFEPGKCSDNSDRANQICLTDEDCALEQYSEQFGRFSIDMGEGCPGANKIGYFFTPSDNLKKDQIERIVVHIDTPENWIYAQEGNEDVITLRGPQWEFTGDADGPQENCDFEDVFNSCSQEGDIVCGDSPSFSVRALFAENDTLYGVDFTWDSLNATIEGDVEVYVHSGEGICNDPAPAESYVYAPDETPWNPPTELCTGSHSDYDDAYCAIAPRVANVIINGVQAGEAEIFEHGYATLTFNSYVDPEQVPLIGYSVDWGDGFKTSLSGLKSNAKSNPDDPHQLVHFVEYWDLYRRKAADQSLAIICPDNSDYCEITPRIQILDNWGWCNGQQSNGDDYGFNSRSDSDSDFITDCLDENPTDDGKKVPWYKSPVTIRVYKDNDKI